MQDLITEYEAALIDVKRMRETANEKDHALLGGMESDLKYALEWMKTGKKPGPVRGIERQAGEYRELSFDPLLMQRYFRSTDSSEYGWDDHYQEDTLGRYDKERLQFALGCLTDKQREIYMMVKGYCFSWQQAADQLGVSKSTIQSALEQSDRRIAKALGEMIKAS